MPFIVDFYDNLIKDQQTNKLEFKKKNFFEGQTFFQSRIFRSIFEGPIGLPEYFWSSRVFKRYFSKDFQDFFLEGPKGVDSFRTFFKDK